MPQMCLNFVNSLICFRSRDADLRIVMLDCSDVTTRQAAVRSSQLDAYVTAQLSSLGLAADLHDRSEHAHSENATSDEVLIVLNKSDVMDENSRSALSVFKHAATSCGFDTRSSATDCARSSQAGQLATVDDVSRAHTSQQVSVISCVTGEGLEEFLKTLASKVKTL